MSFVENFNGFKVRRKIVGNPADHKFIRFNFEKNTWQRLGSFNWYNITPVVARCLHDQEFKLWDEGYEKT